MRTITIEKTAYTFAELSDKAKDKARDWYAEELHYNFNEEPHASLFAAIEYFDAKFIGNWQFDYAGGNWVRGSLQFNKDVSELSGVRLWKYLNNNGYLYNGCEKNKYRKTVMRPLLAGNCPFTGMCYDEAFLDPMREFMKLPNKSTNFEDLISDCISSLLKCTEADYEYQLSDEAMIETCEANGYEFDEEGNLI